MDRWKERLDQSHALWRNHGLTGDGQARAPWSAPSPFSYMEAYRGNHWGTRGWAGLSPDDLITVNLIFSNTNQMIASLSKRNPVPVVTPQRTGESSIRSARIVQILLAYYVYELRMKRQVDRALMDALLSPFGFIRHGFTPSAEKFDSDGNLLDLDTHTKPDVPWIRRVPFWDIRIDPNASSFRPDEDARWCAFRDLIPQSDIAEHPLLKDRRDVTPTVARERRQIEEQGRDNPDLGKDFDEFVEVWWFWDKRDQKRFAMSPGSTKLLMDPDDWPIPYEGLPFDMLAFNEQPDSNIPVSFPTGYWHQQMELNKTRTLMSRIVNSLRRLLIWNETTLTDTDKKRIAAGDLELMESIFVEGSVQEAFNQAQIGTFPSDLLAYDSTIKSDIREAIGISNMDRAQRINVESATEAGGVLQGADVIAGRNEERFELFWSDILRHFTQSLQHTMDQSTTIRIVGEADVRHLQEAQDFIEVSPEDIAGEFDFRVRARSTLPENNDQELAKAAQIFNLVNASGRADVKAWINLLTELGGFDSSELTLTDEEFAATAQVLQDQGVADGQSDSGGGGGGIDPGVVRTLAAR